MAASDPSVASATSASEPAVVHGCKDSGLVPGAENLPRIIAATLCLINRQRHAHGLASVHTNAVLHTVATDYSRSMVTGNFFGHTSADLLKRLKAAKYVRTGRGYAIAENIASAGGAGATPDAIVAMWMASPEHRANILNPAFRDTGIGVVAAMPALVGSGPGATYTQDFGEIT
jgi:uncharacterized protein YkwD